MKSNKKDKRITVRLTPNQDFMLGEISEKIDKSKAEIIRYMINDFVKKYNNATTSK